MWNTSVVQDSNLIIVGMKSLNSAILVKREASVIGSSNNEYSTTNANASSRYYFQIGKQLYPRNGYVYCNTLATTGSVYVDNIMQSILSQSNGYGQLNMTYITADTDYYYLLQFLIRLKATNGGN